MGWFHISSINQHNPTCVVSYVVVLASSYVIVLSQRWYHFFEFSPIGREREREREERDTYVPIPLADLERIGFAVSAWSQVLDSPLSKAWCGVYPVCRIAHPISKSQCRCDLMDAVQNTLQQELSRLSQVASFSCNFLHSSYEGRFSVFLCFFFPLFLSLSLFTTT